MSAQSPLYWHQGLFLTPQHFQLMEGHNHARVFAQNRYSLRHFWGVGAVEFREDALAASKVEIARFEAFFPEGAFVSYPGNAVLNSRTLDDAVLETDKPVTVYVGLKRFTPEKGNVTTVSELELSGPAPSMYLAKADPDMMADQHGDGPAGGVKLLRYALSIFFEHELPGLGAFGLIAVGQLVREGDKVKFTTDFIPPCLTIDSSPVLDKLMRDVTDLVTSRARALEDYKMRGELTAKEFDPGYMVFLLALMTLNRYVPLLEHSVLSGKVHPWDAYGTLLQFLGELSTFAEDFGATTERSDGTRTVPPYDHENLTGCFLAARQLIERMIEGIGTSIELLTALVKKDSYFIGELPERVFRPINRFWLIVRTEQSPETVPQSVLSTVKLCATPLMATLLVKAVPGLPLTYSKNPPAGLPKRSGTHYFLIDTTNPLWLDVARNKSLALFWDSPPEDLSVHVAVLRGK